MTLQTLLDQHACIWRGRRSVSAGQRTVSTGFDALDLVLSGGGWPEGAICELLSEHRGIDLLPLVMPALKQFAGRGKVCLVDPPCIPYAPAWQMAGIGLEHVIWMKTQDAGEQRWVLEQGLRDSACVAVLAWPAVLSSTMLRRLQLAAEEGMTTGFIFRDMNASRMSSPAAVRMALDMRVDGIYMRLLKRRGGWPVDICLQPFSDPARA